MEKEFRYDTQKQINRNEDGKIKSIKPIYSTEDDLFVKFHNQVKDLTRMATTNPEFKYQIEINAMPEQIYKMIKEDVDHKNGFQDGAGKFFYSPTINSVIIVHKEL